MTHKILIGIFCLSLTACTAHGNNLMQQTFGAKVIEGNAAYVIVSDPIGGQAKRVAEDHCKQHKKIAAFKTKDNNSWQCSGTTWCSTYDCVKP